MLSQNECLLKNTLLVPCVKIQGGHAAPPLPTPMQTKTTAFYNWHKSIYRMNIKVLLEHKKV